MADTDINPTEPAAPAMPSMADFQAIADRAEAAARRAEETVAGSGAAAAGAEARQATADQFPGLPDDFLDRISNQVSTAVLADLRREFEVGQPGPLPATPLTTSSSEPGSSSTPTDAATASDDPPAPKTWAQRFAGE